MPPGGLRVHLETSLARFALVTVFVSTMTYGRTGDSCLGSPELQKLAANGGDTQLSYPLRKSAYEQAIKLCPGQPSLYHSLAVLALQNHDFAGGLHLVRAGLRLWPDNPQLQLDEAVAFISNGHPEDSLPILAKLPGTAESQFYLGMAERALGDQKATQHALLKALHLGSQDPYVLYVLIEQDHDLHDKEAGLRDFQTLVKRFPDSAWLHVVLGDAYMSRYKDSNAQSE